MDKGEESLVRHYVSELVSAMSKLGCHSVVYAAWEPKEGKGGGIVGTASAGVTNAYIRTVAHEIATYNEEKFLDGNSFPMGE